MKTYGIPAARFADSNVEAIRGHARDAVENIRAGGGPAFVECVTYRWREHVGPGEDYDAGFRSRSELDRWRDKDEVARLGSALDSGLRAQIDAAIEQEIAAAVDFAEQSPFPPLEELHSHVVAD